MFNDFRSQKKSQGKKLQNFRRQLSKDESDKEEEDHRGVDKNQSLTFSKLSFQEDDEGMKEFKPRKKKEILNKFSSKKEGENKEIKFNTTLNESKGIIKLSNDPSFVITVRPIPTSNKPKIEANINEVEKIEHVRRDLEAAIEGDESNKINIPDANVIFAAHKKRESVRKLASNDYIPISSSNQTDNRLFTESSSRLIREDEGNSDSEDDLTIFNKETLRESLQKTMNESENASSDHSHQDEINSEEDEELRQWETQQMSKGVKMPSISQNRTFGPNIPTYIQFNNINNAQSHKDPKKSQFSFPSIPISDIITSINSKVTDFKSILDKNISEMSEIDQNITLTNTNITTLENQMESRKNAFEFFQYVQSYLFNLTDCINDKISTISKCEKDIIETYKTNMKILENERLQKLNELEERVSSYHSDNDQEDNLKDHIVDFKDQLHTLQDYDQLLLFLKPQLDDIYKNCEHLFDDTSSGFYEIDEILKPFKRMKFEFKESYKDAFMILSLHTLLSPFIRRHLIKWCPLTDSESIKHEPWFKSIVKYSYEQEECTSQAIDDYLLLPNIYEDVIVPRITQFIDCWDCSSSKQTVSLRNHVAFIFCNNPQIKEDSNNYLMLFDAIYNKILKYSESFCIPLFSDRLLHDEQSGALLLLFHQITTCLMFIENIIVWRNLIDDDKLKEIVVDKILNRYISIGLSQISDIFTSLTFLKKAVDLVPLIWLKIGNSKPNHQKNKSLPIFIGFTKQILEQLQSMKSCHSNEIQKINDGIITVNTILQQIS